ncbi:hypothetical protein ACFLZ8_01825 [Planctomycetota bacterium]
MKRLSYLSALSLIVFILFFYGCRSNDITKKAIEVIVDGDGQFPDFLAGRWKAAEGEWEFVFEPDGQISSAVVSIGRVTMKPAQTTTIQMELGGRGVFEPGLWTVQYFQDQRRLIVEISIDYFLTELGENTIQGKTRDLFIGTVSPDGTLWWSERFSYPEYTVNTEAYQNYKLPVDPDENPKESLLFEKESAE